VAGDDKHRILQGRPHDLHSACCLVKLTTLSGQVISLRARTMQFTKDKQAIEVALHVMHLFDLCETYFPAGYASQSLDSLRLQKTVNPRCTCAALWFRHGMCSLYVLHMISFWIIKACMIMHAIRSEMEGSCISPSYRICGDDPCLPHKQFMLLLVLLAACVDRTLTIVQS